MEQLLSNLTKKYNTQLGFIVDKNSIKIMKNAIEHFELMEKLDKLQSTDEEE